MKTKFGQETIDDINDVIPEKILAKMAGKFAIGRLQFVIDEKTGKTIPLNKAVEFTHEIGEQKIKQKVIFYMRRKTYGGLIKLYGNVLK